MAIRVNKNKDAIKDGGSGGLINKSGIYTVDLNYVQLQKTTNGATQLIYNVTHGGMEQVIYGSYIYNTDGNVNEISLELLNKLCIVVGMEEGQELTEEEVENPVGKDRKLVDMVIIPELSDHTVQMRVQMEYSVYKGEIKESKSIKAFYREDGATAAEAESGENIGSRLETDKERYADNVTYKDDLTEADVAEWIKERNNRNKKSDKATPAASTTSKAKGRPMFK